MTPDLLRTPKPEANVEALKKARNSFRFTRSVARELNLSLIINFVISHNLRQCLLEELHELYGLPFTTHTTHPSTLLNAAFQEVKFKIDSHVKRAAQCWWWNIFLRQCYNGVSATSSIVTGTLS